MHSFFKYLFFLLVFLINIPILISGDEEIQENTQEKYVEAEKNFIDEVGENNAPYEESVVDRINVMQEAIHDVEEGDSPPSHFLSDPAYRFSRMQAWRNATVVEKVERNISDCNEKYCKKEKKKNAVRNKSKRLHRRFTAKKCYC